MRDRSASTSPSGRIRCEHNAASAADQPGALRCLTHAGSAGAASSCPSYPAGAEIHSSAGPGASAVLRPPPTICAIGGCAAPPIARLGASDSTVGHRPGVGIQPGRGAARRARRGGGGGERSQHGRLPSGRPAAATGGLAGADRARSRGRRRRQDDRTSGAQARPRGIRVRGTGSRGTAPVGSGAKVVSQRCGPWHRPRRLGSTT